MKYRIKVFGKLNNNPDVIGAWTKEIYETDKAKVFIEALDFLNERREAIIRELGPDFATFSMKVFRVKPKSKCPHSFLVIGGILGRELYVQCKSCHQRMP